jgi:hypothetical protein
MAGSASQFGSPASRPGGACRVRLVLLVDVLVEVVDQAQQVVAPATGTEARQEEAVQGPPVPQGLVEGRQDPFERPERLLQEGAPLRGGDDQRPLRRGRVLVEQRARQRLGSRTEHVEGAGQAMAELGQEGAAVLGVGVGVGVEAADRLGQRRRELVRPGPRDPAQRGLEGPERVGGVHVRRQQRHLQQAEVQQGAEVVLALVQPGAQAVGEPGGDLAVER